MLCWQIKSTESAELHTQSWERHQVMVRLNSHCQGARRPAPGGRPRRGQRQGPGDVQAPGQGVCCPSAPHIRGPSCFASLRTLLDAVELWHPQQGREVLGGRSSSKRVCACGAQTLFKRMAMEKAGDSRLSVDSGPFVFHYLIQAGVCYLTLTDRSYPKKLAYQYLEELQSEFSRLYGPQIEAAARPYAFINFGARIAWLLACSALQRAGACMQDCGHASSACCVHARSCQHKLVLAGMPACIPAHYFKQLSPC